MAIVMVSGHSKKRHVSTEQLQTEQLPTEQLTMKRGFGSDNHSGVCPEVLDAIARVNKEHALAYGDDEFCAATEAKFREQFGEQAKYRN